MPDQFVQLLYLSNPKPELRKRDLDEILEKSRQNNPATEISGLLIFADGVFIQVLEGFAEQVHGLFEKICDDSRHEDVEIIAEYAVKDRLFAKWSMAFIQSTFDELTEITGTAGMLSRGDVLTLLSNDQTKAARFLKDFAQQID